MVERKLIANIWKSPTGEILQSKHRHDFVSDSAGNYIDGGIESYTRMGGSLVGWQDLCVYSDDPHEKQREAFRWGTRGSTGNDPIKWIAPMFMTEEHIEAILLTQTQIPEHIRELFEKELEYRKEIK